MIRRLLYIGMLCLFFSLTGCGKAEITSECTLSGGGDYKCNFKNTGTAEGSSCIRLMLYKTPGAAGVFIPAEAAVIAGSKEFVVTTLDAERARELEKIEGSLDDSAQKMGFSDFAAMAFLVNGVALSKEICSGLVKAGDIRDVNGFTHFLIGKTPVNMCLSIPRGSWGEVCSFSSISSDAVKSDVEKIKAELSLTK